MAKRLQSHEVELFADRPMHGTPASGQQQHQANHDYAEPIEISSTHLVAGGSAIGSRLRDLLLREISNGAILTHKDRGCRRGRWSCNVSRRSGVGVQATRLCTVTASPGRQGLVRPLSRTPTSCVHDRSLCEAAHTFPTKSAKNFAFAQPHAAKENQQDAYQSH